MSARGMGFAAVLFALAMTGATLAQDGAGPTPAGGENQLQVEVIKRRLAEILRQPEFQTKKVEEQWRYKGTPNQAQPRDNPWWVKLFGEIGRILAHLSEALLWALVLFGVALVLIHYRRWIGFFSRPAPRVADVAPEQLFGLDLRPESLPADIPGAARDLWQQGRHREALSLLYRGALSVLVVERGVELGRSATEEECLRIVAARTDARLADYFRRLVAAWQAAAYASRVPQAAEGRILWEEWAGHFRRRDAA
ncbi:MAG: hypothetical protein HYU77_14435 [Betaproteobacteria bacterium]|nr:hypothetical protein [Betaproteobacteria bacterium]